MFAPKAHAVSSTPNNFNFGSNNHAFIQPKLNIGQPGDKYEVEADKAADQIVARKKESPSSFLAPAPIVQKQSEEEVQKQENEIVQQKPVVESITPLIQRKNSDEEDVVQRKCSACGKEKEVQRKGSDDFISNIQRKESITGVHTIQQKCDCHKDDATIQKKGGKDKGKESSITDDAYQQLKGNQNLESTLANSKGGGKQLDKETKTEMESGFGADFSNVRIHTDSTAVGMNKELGAQAFTNGNDIYFNEGKYNPQSDAGKHLLAHELTHTLQQGASNTKEVQRFELPGFVQDGLDVAGDLYDGAVDTVADGIYDVTEALGVTDEVLEAYETASEVAGEVYDATTDFLIKSRDWLLTTAGQAARALVESLGGTMTVTSEGIIVSLPKICPVPAVDFDIPIPPIEQDLLVPVFAIPVIAGVIDGVITGEIGGTMVVDPQLSMQLGPFCLEGAELVINPLTGNYSVSGGVSATAAVSMGAEARAGLKAGLGFMGVIIAGEIPIPLDISLISIEGGVAGLGRAIGIGKKTMEGSLGYSNGALTMTSADQLDLGLAADLFLGTYGQLSIGGFNFCRLYWEPYEWHNQIGAIFNTSTELVIGPNPSVTKTATAEIGEFPFEEYELLLGRGGFEDDCPLEDMLCWILDKLNLFPSQRGGTWENYGAGEQFTEGPKEVFGRDPQRASGAKCRGACGPDCMTCNSEEKYRYTDPETGETWEYINYEDCNTHEGCREHDAGFDWAAEQNWLERSIVSIVAPWHMAANIECACNYPSLNCPAWIAGLPPYDGKLYFADSVTKVTGKDAGEGDSLHDKIQAIEIFFFDKDPEEHRLYVDILEGNEVVIMMQTEPKPVKQAIVEEQQEDTTDTQEEEEDLRTAEEIRRDLTALIEGHLKDTDEEKKETDSIRDKIVEELQALAKVLESGGIDHRRDLPLTAVTYEMKDGKAYKVTASPLTEKAGNTKGSRPTAEDIPGWGLVRTFDEDDVIIKEGGEAVVDKDGNVKTRRTPINWVKFHLLSQELHGPGEKWNLVPANKSDNGRYEKNMEKGLKEKVNGYEILSFSIEVDKYHDGIPNEQDTTELERTDKNAYDKYNKWYQGIPEHMNLTATNEAGDSLGLTEFDFKGSIDVTVEPGVRKIVMMNVGRPTLVRYGISPNLAKKIAKMTSPSITDLVNDFFTSKVNTKVDTVLDYLFQIKGFLESSTKDSVKVFSEKISNKEVLEEIDTKIEALRWIGAKYSGDKIYRHYIDAGHTNVKNYHKTLDEYIDTTIEGVQFKIKRPGSRNLGEALRASDRIHLEPLQNYFILYDLGKIE